MYQAFSLWGSLFGWISETQPQRSMLKLGVKHGICLQTVDVTIGGVEVEVRHRAEFSQQRREFQKTHGQNNCTLEGSSILFPRAEICWRSLGLRAGYSSLLIKSSYGEAMVGRQWPWEKVADPWGYHFITEQQTERATGKQSSTGGRKSLPWWRARQGVLSPVPSYCSAPWRVRWAALLFVPWCSVSPEACSHGVSQP